MFKIRIPAKSEDLSLKFALRILPVIERIKEERLPICCLFSKDDSNLIKQTSIYEGSIKLSDINEWSWENVCQKVKELSEKGIKLLLITDQMWDWKIKNEFINEDLELFEDALSLAGMSVIGIEEYGSKNQWIEDEFKKVTEWKTIPVKQGLESLLKDYIDDSLVLPFGHLPFFILSPNTTEEDINNGEVDCLAGCFKEEAFQEIINNYGTIKGPNVSCWIETSGVVALKLIF